MARPTIGHVLFLSVAVAPLCSAGWAVCPVHVPSSSPAPAQHSLPSGIPESEESKEHLNPAAWESHGHGRISWKSTERPSRPGSQDRAVDRGFRGSDWGPVAVCSPTSPAAGCVPGSGTFTPCLIIQFSIHPSSWSHFFLNFPLLSLQVTANKYAETLQWPSKESQPVLACWFRLLSSPPDTGTAWSP